MTDFESGERVADKAPFPALCRVLEKISATAKERDKQRNYMMKFIDQWRINHKNLHGVKKTDDSFFDAMRLVAPAYDKERGAYGLKEHMLATRLIDALMMDKNGEDAKRLLNYKAPLWQRGAVGDQVGDFAAVASEILKLRVSKSSSDNLTIAEVNRRLDTIALANLNKEKKAMEVELEWLCRKVDHVELKWILRILLKQMRMGMSEATILDLYHPDANQLYDVSTSLRQVCEQLRDPNAKLDVIQIELFAPFRPMLANKVEPEQVAQIMGNAPFYIETKYDGERMQLHKRGTSYRYFSRNGNDFTGSFGGLPTSGSLTQHIHKSFRDTVHSCILDGEMLGWNTLAKCLATKAESFDVKSLKDGDDLWVCFVVFDCLLLNDQVLTLKPLSERLDILREIFTETEGRFMIAKQETKETTNDVIDAMNKAVEQREEGVVIKRPDSTYRLNARSKEGGWLKIKPDYLDSLNDDLDLLIIGGYYGQGRRSNLLSHFLLGLAAPSKDEDGLPQRFVSCGKVGSGYSMKELYKLNLYLNTNPLRIAGNKVPSCYSLGTERPDIYIEPKNSKILQIRAAEINSSLKFGCGFGLRFPRVQKIRDDKNWSDAMTVAEFESIRKEFEGKLAQKKLVEDKSESLPLKKRRVGTHSLAARSTIGSHFRQADIKNLIKTSDIFQDKEICVITGCSGFSKQDLETKIVEAGGTIVQNPGSETFCAVSDRLLVKVKNIIAGRLTNVVKGTWLIDCFTEGRFIALKPTYMWFSNDDTSREFARDFDQFGDSYTAPTTVRELTEIITSQNVKPVPSDEADEILMEYFPDYKYGLFCRCRTYFDIFDELENAKTKIITSSLHIISAEYRLHSGKIAESLNEATHVVVDPKCMDRLKNLIEINRQKARKFHVVTSQWITDSISNATLLPEVPYQPTLDA